MGRDYLAPLRKKISVSTAGDNTIVDPGANKRVLVLSLAYVCGGDVTVKEKFGDTEYAEFDWWDGGGPYHEFHKLDCVWAGGAGEALKLNLSAAVAVKGSVFYLLERV
jgi:hypothetical protein